MSGSITQSPATQNYFFCVCAIVFTIILYSGCGENPATIQESSSRDSETIRAIRLLDLKPARIDLPDFQEIIEMQDKIIWRDNFDEGLTSWTFFHGFPAGQTDGFEEWQRRSRAGSDTNHIRMVHRIDPDRQPCLAALPKSEEDFCIYGVNVAIEPDIWIKTGLWMQPSSLGNGHGELWIMETEKPVDVTTFKSWDDVEAHALKFHSNMKANADKDRWNYLSTTFRTGSECRNLLVLLKADGETGSEVLFDGVEVRRHLDRWVIPDKGKGYLDFQREKRDALIMPPGSVIEWDINSNPADRIYLSLFSGCTESLLSESVTLTLDTTYPDGNVQRILTKSFGPEKKQYSKWYPLLSDMTLNGSRPVKLTAATLAKPAVTPTTNDQLVFVALGHPVLVSAPGKVKPKNLILISLDTLRYDRSAFSGNAVPVTPFLDRFTRSSLLFANCCSHAPSTLPSHASVFTSLYPSEHGLNRPLTNTFSSNTLIITEILRRNGYLTAGFTGGGQMSSKFGFQRGFDLYNENLYDAGPVVDHGIRWMENIPGEVPFFLFLHTYEIHHPYRPPDILKTAFDENYSGSVDGEIQTLRDINHGRRTANERDIEFLLNMYDAQIRNVDHAISRLVVYLQENALLDNTLIVLFSDHGEEFNEHGSVGWHSHSLYDELVRVPLLIHFPKAIPEGRIFDTPVFLVDLLPTIMDYLDLELEPEVDGKWNGVSLKSLAGSGPGGIFQDRPFFCEKNWDEYEHAVTYRDHKLIYDFAGRIWRMYDLASDPREQQLLPLTGDIFNELQSLLMTHTIKTHQGYVILMDPGSRKAVTWDIEFSGHTSKLYPLPLWMTPGDTVAYKPGVTGFHCPGSAYRKGVCISSEALDEPLQIHIRADGIPIRPEQIFLGSDSLPARSNPLILNEHIDTLSMSREIPVEQSGDPIVLILQFGNLRSTKLIHDSALEDELRALGYLM